MSICNDGYQLKEDNTDINNNQLILQFKIMTVSLELEQGPTANNQPTSINICEKSRGTTN